MPLFLRFLRRFAVAITAFLAIYFTAALAGAVIPGRITQRDGPPGIRVALIAGPIHYDFLLPATDETRAAFGFARADGVPVDHPGAEWILAGWGSRAFYTATGSYLDLGPGTVMKAATGDEGVLRVDVLGPIAEDGLLWITLGEAGYAALLDFIRSARTGPRVPETGFTPTDAFFEAGAGFHLFRTCNTWIGEALLHAGHPAGRWTPTTWSLRWSVLLHG